jgi:hypothetical protein
MNRLISFIIIFTLGCLIISCNDDVNVGSSLIGDQPIEADFNDQLEITAKTVEPQSRFIGYRNRTDYNRAPYLLGALDDPNFGKTSSTVFVTPRIDNEDIPDFKISMIDSVVMVIPYDTSGIYGDASAMHHISVYRLQDIPDLESIDTLYTDTCIEYEDIPIVEIDIVPAPFDSLDIYSPLTDTLLKVVPQLRLRLDNNLWQSVLSDTLNTIGTQSLINQIKGYAITSEPTSSSMYGVNLLSTGVAGIEVFYTDSISSVYSLDLATTSLTSTSRSETSIKHSCFESNYSGSEVERTLGDSLAQFNYLQGMEGFNVEYDLSSVIDIQNVFINYAVLEIYLLEDADSPIDQLLCTFVDSLGVVKNIADFDIPGTRATYFDGALKEVEENGMTLKKYEIIVTNQVIDIRNGKIKSPYVYLSPFGRGLPRHSILYSPNEPNYPAKLKLITTKP